MMKHNPSYRPELDGLRAFAVIGVMLAHSVPQYVPGGYIGVDVFFVLSGFLITSGLLGSSDFNIDSIVKFFGRRFRRLLPAQFLLLLFVTPISWFLLLPEQFKIFSGSVFANGFLLSNFYFATQLEYWQQEATLQPLLHMWSLSIEEQYYLILPFVFLVFSRINLSWFFLFVVSGTVVGIVVSHLGVTSDPAKNYFHSFSRFWEIGIGCCLAVFMRFYQIKHSGTLSGLGALAILYSFFYFDRNTQWPSLYSLVPTLGASLIIAYTKSGTAVHCILSRKIFVGIGVISYGVYLWHQPIFAFSKMYYLSELGLVQWVLIYILVFFVAFLSFIFVERPAQLRKLQFLKSEVKTIFVFALTSLFFSISGLCAYLFSEELNSLRDDAYSSITNRLRANFGLRSDCHLSVEQCKSSGVPNYIVWGDSYAMHLVPGLISGENPISIVQKTMSACPPYVGFGFAPLNFSQAQAVAWADGCIKFNDETLAYIEDSKIPNIILSSKFLYSSTMINRNGVFVSADDKTSYQISALTDLIRHLSSIGKRVFVVGPTPSVNFDIGMCGAKTIVYDRAESSCDFSLEASNYNDFAKFASSLNGNFKLIHLIDVICPDGLCDVIQGDTLLYRDSGHLSIEGSVLLGAYLQDQLR